METIRLQTTVYGPDITIESSELLKFLNQKVDISISLVKNQKLDIDKILKIARNFDEDARKSFKEAILECRQIDYKDWE